MEPQKQFWTCQAGVAGAAIDPQKRTCKSGRGAQVRARRCGPCSQMRTQFPLSDFRICDGISVGAVPEMRLKAHRSEISGRKRAKYEGFILFFIFALESSRFGNVSRDFQRKL